jgi:hypothetical protein
MNRATRASFALAVLLAAGPAWAKGAKPVPPPRAPNPALPPGCERLADGRDSALSHDGRRLAFARWGPSGEVDYRGDDIPASKVYVRDLAAKKEARVPGVRGVPVAWTTAGGLALSSGVVVDPTTGKRIEATAALPAGVRADSIAWTRDGTRLAYVPVRDDKALLRDGHAALAHITEIDGSGKERAFEFGEGLSPGEQSMLAWSADDKRLAFNAIFFRRGSVPPRLAGYLDLTAEPAETIVDEIPMTNGIPGLHAARAPMLPHAGTTGPTIGDDVWDSKASLLAFVTGGGDGDADIWIYDVETEQRRRQTSDGATKWSPAVDDAGRRVAFLTGVVPSMPMRGRLTLAPELLEIANARLCVVDLLTGAIAAHAIPGGPAYPGRVRWAPDDARVIYEIHGGAAQGTYAQTVAPVGPAPAGMTRPRDVGISSEDEVLAGLRSPSAQRVEVAAERAASEWSPRLRDGLREALSRWADAEDYRPATAILRVLEGARALEALPEIRAALGSKAELTVLRAIDAVVSLDGRVALADLDALRAKGPTTRARSGAAVAMAALGDERGWPDVETAAKSKDADVRGAVARSLRTVRLAKSVDLLLTLVSDEARLYTTHGGDIVVGDHAVESLLVLTGTFHRLDAQAWSAWWQSEAKGVLPESPETAEARAAFDAWMDEREAAHQEKMRKALEPFVPK